ncbi:MAG: hypothetical protein QM771_15460 [Nitrospira sp.]
MPCVHAHDSPVLEMCGCGRFYLTYGPVTVAFKLEEFVSFARNVARLADTAVEKIAKTTIAETQQTH